MTEPEEKGFYENLTWETLNSSIIRAKLNGKSFVYVPENSPIIKIATKLNLCSNIPATQEMGYRSMPESLLAACLLIIKREFDNKNIWQSE